MSGLISAPDRSPIQKPLAFPVNKAIEDALQTENPELTWGVNVDGKLPEDFVAVPLWHQQGNWPLKLCIICRRTPDPIQQYLLHRRDLLDAKVYLGCLLDAAGVMEYLEIWVQNLDGLNEAAQSRILSGDAINNTTMDERWHGMVEASLTSWPGAMVACGFEKINPLPSFINLKDFSPVHPEGFQLCRDDRVLAGAGLPIFSNTRHRYLSNGRNRFIPLYESCPKNQNTSEYDTVLPDYKNLVPVNPAGGLLSIRRAGNFRLRDFAAILSGKRYSGATYGRSRFRAGPVRAVSSLSGSMFFPGEPLTNSARFVETYLVKLSLFLGMINEVGRFTAQAKRPLLNLQPASFIISLDDPGPSLPALWAARPALIDGGEAIPITFPQGDTSYSFFLPGKSLHSSIYQPASVSRGTVTGFGQLYLSSGSTPPESASKTFEGMLTVVDPIRPTRRDIIRIRLPVGNRRLDLYVRVEPDAGPTPAVLKIRSVPDARIQPAETEIPIGVPLEVSYEHYPLFGSACDVYSLAVLAVEIMLTSATQSSATTMAAVTHAEQLRDVFSLATRCREIYSDRPLIDRIQSIFAERPEWLKKLGPQCMILGSLNPEQALRLATPELWFATLAFIIKMLPGYGPDSYLKDLGDTLQDETDQIYVQLAADLEFLLQRARSLVFGEWGLNREIGMVLKDMTGSLLAAKS